MGPSGFLLRDVSRQTVWKAWAVLSSLVPSKIGINASQEMAHYESVCNRQSNQANIH